jgi:hypothetical protein
MFPATAASQNQAALEEAPFSGIVFYFQAHQGWGKDGKAQAVFGRGDPRDKAEGKKGQAQEPRPFKQVMGGFQLQTDGTGFPGVGMAQVGKDKAPCKNRGKDHKGRQNDEQKLFLRQPNHKCYYRTKKPIMQPSF